MPLLVLQRALARCEMRQEKLRALLRPHPSARLPRAAQRTRFCALLLEGVRTHAREQEGANEKRLSAAICLSAAISDKTAGKFRRQYSNNKGEGGGGGEWGAAVERRNAREKRALGDDRDHHVPHFQPRIGAGVWHIPSHAHTSAPRTREVFEWIVSW